MPQNVMTRNGSQIGTQIPGFAAPPGGPLARGDAVLVVDGLSWVQAHFGWLSRLLMFPMNLKRKVLIVKQIALIIYGM